MDLTSLLARSGYLPHGYCFTWSPGILWSMVGADSVIAAAYFSIPLTIATFVRKRADWSMSWVAGLFIAFIFACGTTHVMDIWTIWRPDYALQAASKLATAAVSIITAIALWRLIPKALALPSVEKLQSAVTALEAEVKQRRRAEEHLDAMFEQTDDLIAILDGRGRIASINPAFERATGWTSEQATAGPMAVWQTPLPAHATQQHRSELQCRDGTHFVVEWSVSPIQGRDGEVLNHVCIGRDITRQMQVEEGLRDNDKLRAVATLAGGIAHDFNNLLGSIIGLAELCALDAAEGSRQARNLDRIGLASTKAAVLVRQMLDFSRQTPKKLQLLPVGDLLGQVEALLRVALPPRVALTVRIDQDGPVRIDVVQMEQVLLNITRNAAQAMGESAGEVGIVVDRAEPGVVTPGDAQRRHVRIRVADSGEGIAPEVLNKIFEPSSRRGRWGKEPGSAWLPCTASSAAMVA